MGVFDTQEARVALYNEFHARPFAHLRAPERATHLAMLSADCSDAEIRDYLDAICDRYGAAHAPRSANHFQADLGPLRLKWERHTEYVSYTFFRSGEFADPFEASAIADFDAELLKVMPGRLIVGTHVALLPRTDEEPGFDRLRSWFVPESLAASAASGGAAQVWTDFQVHGDGYGRLLIREVDMGERQAGRLIQRLLEIDTYRILAMGALPLARDADPRVTEIENELKKITARLNEAKTLEAENSLLDDLTRLSGGVEEVSAATAFRFGAARAYSSLVAERIGQLREERMHGFQTVGEFMSRRLAPAMRTCESVAVRQEALARRIERAANLLRTRVDLALERQNSELLASMDRRAQLQLRLQATIEGLSVAAITYYIVGLVGYLSEALITLGLAVDKSLVRGFAIPVVALLCWIGMHRIRKRIMGDGRGGEGPG